MQQVTSILFLMVYFCNAENDIKISSAFSEVKQSTAKYGKVTDGDEFVKELEYNLNDGNDFYEDSKCLSKKYNNNYNYKNNNFLKLVEVGNNICDCAVTLFYNFENENQCYSNCNFKQKKRCKCDYLSLNNAMLVLCYKHNCGPSPNEMPQNIFIPISKFFFYVTLTFLFCLSMAYNIIVI